MGERLMIAGGGLSGVLLALAVAKARPDVELCVVERGKTLGGDHTWSFYGSDLSGPAADLVAPLVGHRWDGYDVYFEGFQRTLSAPYRSVLSPRLHEVAMGVLGDRVRLSAEIADVDGRGVTLASGERLAADAVVDARGGGQLAGAALRWQTFLGQVVRLSAPHGLVRPTIMDARVAQVGGYRFVYVLPFSADTLLIEDTYYADTPGVDAPVLRERIADYAAGRGWRVAEIVREEIGALPLLLGGDFGAMWAGASAGGAVPVGLRAGLFHPVTGYSLPVAARIAVALAGVVPLTTDALMGAAERFATTHFERAGFDRLLNRMLFLAGEAGDRHRVLSRFYRLPEPLIERFYAGASTRADRFRILVGKPPVPVGRAMRVLSERAAFSARR